MQDLIGKDAILTIIDYQIARLTQDGQNDDSDRACIAASIQILEELKTQLDFIMPIRIPVSA